MKLIAVCPAYEQDGPRNRAILDKTVRESMAKKGGSVNSASGSTAALAINYCERYGYSYKVSASVIMEGGQHRYYVERTS